MPAQKAMNKLINNFLFTYWTWYPQENRVDSPLQEY